MKNTSTILLFAAFITGYAACKAINRVQAEAIYQYGQSQKMKAYEESALRANALIKNRHKEFVTKRWHFQATQYGLSLDL